MTKKEYFEYHALAVAKMTAITRAKNADYSGTGDDPFLNFTRVEALGICSTEQGFLTRMTDKMSRLASFVQRGELSVKDESVEDTLLDLANYAILLAAYVAGKKVGPEQLELPLVVRSTDNSVITPCTVPIEHLHGKPEHERHIDAVAP